MSHANENTVDYLMERGFTKPQAQNEIARRERVANCEHAYRQTGTVNRTYIQYECSICGDEYEKDVS